MKLRYKISLGVLLFVAVAVVSLAFALSHDSSCGTPPQLAPNARLMKGIVYRCYGSPEVLKLEDIEKPLPGPNEVLVKVRVAGVNPLDWHYMRGIPYIMRMESGLGRPTNPRLGVDFSGVVEAVGKDVARFKAGDEVFGGKFGAFAEYVRVDEDRALVLKPPNITFEEAASVPVAAITALQALRDKGRVRAGQKVLINGASGGVGTFAVQIAKHLGAEVTGVCSTRNVSMVQSLGADHVIDYTREDFTKSEQKYDVIVDMVGNHPLLEYRRALTPMGVFVIVGGPNEGHWLGPMVGPIKAAVISPFVDQEFAMILSELNQKDLAYLNNLLQIEKLTPVIDRRYRLSEVPAAIEYLEKGRARGKVLISLE